jgi:hypothetical protein
MVLFKVIDERDACLKDSYYSLQVAQGGNGPCRNRPHRCTASLAVDPVQRCLREAGVCRPNGRHAGDYHSQGVA